MIAKKVAIAEQFVLELTTEKYLAIRKYFDDAMQKALPAATLKQTWEALKHQYGPFKQIIKIRTEQKGQFLCIFVTCEFTLIPIDVNVVINEDNKVSGLYFLPAEIPYGTPSYANLDVFDEISVTVGNLPWTLAGTLSIPKGNGPFAAVVLVHGSGPNDRDETISSNKPFRDLAWGLSSRGIAVLRYDKRTYVYNNIQEVTGMNFTVHDEVIEDAVAAVGLLRKQPRINKKRIYILGHSMGGMLIPRIGLRELSVAGFIIMAGNVTPLEDLLIRQTKYLVFLDGEVSEEEEDNISNINEMVKKIKELKRCDIDSTDLLLLGVPPAYWLDLQGYNPAKFARKLEKPILILQGERDYQIPMDDFDQWKKELSSKNKVKFISYPNLNHLFIEGQGKPNPYEYFKPGNVSKSVIDDIMGWLLQGDVISNNTTK